MAYQIVKRTEADCDGGRTFFVVIDIDNNDEEISEWFETEDEAQYFIDN